MIVGGTILPDASPYGGRNSRLDSWTIADSMCEAFTISPGIS